MTFTCTRGGERATTEIVLTPSGEREAIICPVHGILAYAGFKPAGGTAAVRAADGSTTLAHGEFSKLGASAWIVRAPGSPQSLLRGMAVTENADGSITVANFLDGSNWKGWLEAGVWIEEER